MYSQKYIADYEVANEDVLRSIPEEFINTVKTELVIAYQHTSHGTHVSRGVFGLQDYKSGDEILFAVSSTPQGSKLEFRDYALASYAPVGIDASDLSRDETAFIQTTRNYLDAPENANVNVIMWSWCNIAGHDVAGNYLPGMDLLISEYGVGGSKIGTGTGQRVLSVNFIFMTGHANVNANVGESRPKSLAALINDHCNANGYFCLDYYSIDTHDMVDNYWEDAGDNGNSVSYGGNFYVDWQNSHALGTDYFENKTSPGGSVTFGAHNTQHITANRKAYAMWWILARISGWDGNPVTVPVSQINVSSAGGVTEILTGGTLQFTAEVLPSDATNKDITWSVTNQTGEATITQEGLLTATSEGTVTVVATAQDGSGISGSLQITITDPVVPVTTINVTSIGGVTEMLTGSMLQFSAEVLPTDATNKDIAWSVLDQTGSGTITQGGLFTATLEGTVTVVATAQDGSGVTGSMQISITDPVVPVALINVTSVGGVTEMLTGGTLQFSAEVLPTDATNKEIVWSVTNQTGSGTITQGGLLTATSEGTVTVVATAQDGSGVTGNLQIMITDPEVPVTTINVTSEGGVTELLTGGTLQFSADVLLSNATNKDITWSVLDQTGSGTITQGGLLTAMAPGTVTVVATAQDGSGVTGGLQITVTDPVVTVTTINVTSVGGITEILTGGTLQFTAEVLPSDATNKNITWSVTNQTGEATITQGGLLTATSEGTVTVVATAQDGSGATGSLQISITDLVVPVTTINVTSVGGVTEMLTGGMLQFSANVLPSNATNKDITWSVTNQTGEATITQGGLLTATSEGTVTVVATAQDGSGVTGSLQIMITDPVMPVTTINVTLVGGVAEMLTGGTLQFSANVLPSNATNKDIIWSVLDQTGSGTITQGGLLTATSEGTVTVVATAQDGSGATGSLQISITDPVVLVTTINVTSVGGVTELLTGGTLQFSANVLPLNATNKDITWSVTNQTGEATITQGGLLTATSEGTITVVATAQDGSGVTGSLQIMITDPVVPVTTINVTSVGEVTEMLTGGTLQFTAEVLPAGATNKAIIWSVLNQTGSATITQGGLLTATSEGTVTVVATAQDGSGVTTSMQITISDQKVMVSSISVISEGGITVLPIGNSLQFSVEALPYNATDKDVIWRVNKKTGDARITQEGLFISESEGTVDVIAITWDGSGKRDTMELTITSSVILVNDINITTTSGVTEIGIGGTLQFILQVLPTDATNQNVIWRVENETGEATITQGGLLTAVAAGTVIVIATAQDGSGVECVYAVKINDWETVVDENEMFGLSVYPNPSKGVFYLEVGENNIDLIQVVGFSGSIMIDMIPESGLSLIKIDLSMYPPGPYFIRMYADQHSIVNRVIIVR
ncbi:MAG: Ig-like domain-containing protein [Bacteroidales bacterium]|nr:Ig-like domain-containing protein [Bacteroidales bacterium]